MKDTKHKILDLAEHLVRTKGYNGFSYKDISTRLGMKNAAIHYHYPSKNDLGVAIIERTRANFVAASNRWKNLPEQEQLQQFIAIYQRSYAQHLVCLMGAMGPSFDNLPESIQANLKMMGTELKTWLENILNQGLKNGVFQFEGLAKEKASMIISALLSSLILSKVLGENVLENVVQGVLKIV